MNNAYYEDLRREGSAPGAFTEEMQAELLALEESLKAGTYGADFPWARRDVLMGAKLAAALPADYRDLARSRFLALQKAAEAIYLAAARNSSIPITPANVEAVSFEAEQLREKIKQIPVALEQLRIQDEREAELFGCPVPSLPAPLIQPASLGLTWKGPRTEFIELMYALFEADALTIDVKGGRKEAIERLGNMLGVRGTTDPHTVIQDIKNKRNGDRQTPLLDRLKTKLLDYLSR